MIQLGNRVRCIVTGFIGIATSRVEYLNGCVQYCVKPPVDKDGKNQEGLYFDEAQLEYVDGGVTINKYAVQPGGDRSDAPSDSYGGSR